MRDPTLTVALDTTLTPALVSEGFAREFVNRIQHLRKEAGFEVTDRIRIRYAAGKVLGDALAAHAEYVRNETLAVGLDAHQADGGSELEINGERCAVAIERVKRNGANGS